MNWRAVITELRKLAETVPGDGRALARILADALEKGLEYKTIKINEQENTDARTDNRLGR